MWRRRQCESCKAIFTTLEQADLASTLRIKRSETTLEPFMRDQLFVSIYDSCKHRQHALSDAVALTNTCIAAILHSAANGITYRKDIVSETVGVLKRFDAVAATMYQAYHPLADV